MIHITLVSYKMLYTSSVVVVASVVVVSSLSLCKALFALFGRGIRSLLSFTVGGFINFMNI